jgi:hypothetical protein
MVSLYWFIMDFMRDMPAAAVEEIVDYAPRPTG